MRKTPEINTYRIQSRKLRNQFVFAFLSDLHGFPAEKVSSSISAIDPDAVLIGGDFIQNREEMGPDLLLLQRLSSRWPVFCSSGKEHSFSNEHIKQIEDTGTVFLRNRAVLFHDIWIGGLNTIPLEGKSLPEREKLIGSERAWLSEYCDVHGYKLLLCHHPEYYDLFVREYPIDLVLAGHAHGGQIRAFGRGLWAPGQGWTPKYTSGLYDGRLLVGRGLGNTYRIPRINNRPEVLKIVLSHGE